ncbi:MAG: pyridoxine 5'-phosphate synthase [Planctomycetota bacterium]
MIRLGVNIDHVATLRQARRGAEPDPVRAAVLAEIGGADSITVHLREDRRHIQERDVRLLAQTIVTPLNLEMAVNNGVLEVARSVRPYQCTLVPEKREEVTTEGGIDIRTDTPRIAEFVRELKAIGARVAMFIDPVLEQVDLSKEVGADAVEFHTGPYSYAKPEDVDRELDRLFDSAFRASEIGLSVHAGHGLNYRNIIAILHMPALEEVNIGHSIISHSVFVGLEKAVNEMKQLLLLSV